MGFGDRVQRTLPPIMGTSRKKWKIRLKLGCYSGLWGGTCDVGFHDGFG